MTYPQILWWLMVGHALCDFALQNDFLAKGKNHKNPIPGIPWQACLAAHAMIHGGAVALITGSILLGVVEVLFHACFDYLKCDGCITFRQDQLLHWCIKIALAGLVPFVR